MKRVGRRIRIRAVGFELQQVVNAIDGVVTMYCANSSRYVHYVCSCELLLISPTVIHLKFVFSFPFHRMH